MTLAEIHPYFVTTPYIDAYKHGGDGYSPFITFKEFEFKLKLQSMEWGEQGLGRAALLGHDLPRSYEDTFVLAIGRWGRDQRQYAAVMSPGMDQPIVVQFDWPYEWDVT